MMAFDYNKSLDDFEKVRYWDIGSETQKEAHKLI